MVAIHWRPTAGVPQACQVSHALSEGFLFPVYQAGSWEQLFSGTPAYPPAWGVDTGHGAVISGC